MHSVHFGRLKPGRNDHAARSANSTILVSRASGACATYKPVAARLSSFSRNEQVGRFRWEPYVPETEDSEN
jgi:hypothetical protein